MFWFCAFCIGLMGLFHSLLSPDTSYIVYRKPINETLGSQVDIFFGAAPIVVS